MKGILLILTLTFSSILFANEDDIESTDMYQEVLQRHAKAGHINKEDIEKQEFYFEKDKQWRKDFNKKVRGIASSLKSPKDIIQLDNPAIEIPVK